MSSGTVCKILGQEEIKPHKVRYYLERRAAEFEQKMAEVLCVYREVQVLKKAAAKSNKPDKPVAIVSYDEKPGIQAIATTAPDLPPEPLASTRPSRVITQNANLARRPSSRPLRVHLHAQQGSCSTSSRGSSPSSPARSYLTSAWHQNRSSNGASWPGSRMSIAAQSSTRGPTSSPRPPDMIRTKKT
jgi:hypothetical protein